MEGKITWKRFEGEAMIKKSLERKDDFPIVYSRHDYIASKHPEQHCGPGSLSIFSSSSVAQSSLRWGF